MTMQANSQVLWIIKASGYLVTDILQAIPGPTCRLARMHAGRSPPGQEVESQIKEADSTKSAKDAKPKEELGNRQSAEILVHSPLVVSKKVSYMWVTPESNQLQKQTMVAPTSPLFPWLDAPEDPDTDWGRAHHCYTWLPSKEIQELLSSWLSQAIFFPPVEWLDSEWNCCRFWGESCNIS